MIKLFYFDDCIYYIKYEKLLSEYKRASLSTFKSDKYKRNTCTANLLLAYALNSINNSVPPIDIQVLDGGKPNITDGLHFNISHTKGAVLVGISDSPIGVDIEPVNRRVGKSVQKKLYTKSEQSWCDNKNNKPSLIWTIKESVIKLGGWGLSYGAQNLSIQGIENLEINKSIEVVGKNSTSYKVISLQIVDYYISASSAKLDLTNQTNCNKLIKRVTKDELNNFLQSYII